MPQSLRDRIARPVCSIKGRAQILEKLCAVMLHTLADRIERLDRQAARILFRLQHQRRHRTNQNSLRHALCAVAPDVTRHFPSAGRVTHVNRIFKSSDSTSSATSSAYVFISLPSQGWLDRPCPRRSCAMQQKPLFLRNWVGGGGGGGGGGHP